MAEGIYRQPDVQRAVAGWAKYGRRKRAERSRDEHPESADAAGLVMPLTMSHEEWLECQLGDQRRWYRQHTPCEWMAHLWDNVALWVALETIRAMNRQELDRQIRAEAGHP